MDSSTVDQSTFNHAVGFLIGLQGIIIALVGFLIKQALKWNQVLWEHNLMWNDYAVKHGLMVRSLHTSIPGPPPNGGIRS